jgi:hypothetical protein
LCSIEHLGLFAKKATFPTERIIAVEHVYDIRPRKDKRGVDLISDALPFGRLWYGDGNAMSNAVGYAKFYSRSHDAVVRVFDLAGNVIDSYNRSGEFREP